MKEGKSYNPENEISEALESKAQVVDFILELSENTELRQRAYPEKTIIELKLANGDVLCTQAVDSAKNNTVFFKHQQESEEDWKHSLKQEAHKICAELFGSKIDRDTEITFLTPFIKTDLQGNVSEIKHNTTFKFFIKKSKNS